MYDVIIIDPDSIVEDIDFEIPQRPTTRKERLLIKLFKDGCDPTNKVILFETSYDDYKLAKGEEEGEYQLVLNMSARYQKKAISGTIKNELDNNPADVLPVGNCPNFLGSATC